MLARGRFPASRARPRSPRPFIGATPMTAPRLVALLALTLSGCVLLAQEKKPDAQQEEGFVSLFNGKDTTGWAVTACKVEAKDGRSEERRVGKECRSRWSPYHYKKKAP